MRAVVIFVAEEAASDVIGRSQLEQRLIIEKGATEGPSFGWPVDRYDVAD